MLGGGRQEYLSSTIEDALQKGYNIIYNRTQLGLDLFSSQNLIS